MKEHEFSDVVWYKKRDLTYLYKHMRQLEEGNVILD